MGTSKKQEFIDALSQVADELHDSSNMKNFLKDMRDPKTFSHQDKSKIFNNESIALALTAIILDHHSEIMDAKNNNAVRMLLLKCLTEISPTPQPQHRPKI